MQREFLDMVVYRACLLTVHNQRRMSIAGVGVLHVK
jgi:hypothetical protein